LFQIHAATVIGCLPILYCNAEGEDVLGGTTERYDAKPSAEKVDRTEDNEVSTFVPSLHFYY
jgi:hypothetical protein